MREKTVEQKLVKAVRAAGGICPKWTAPGFDGLPDRIVLLPGGRMGFVEVKAPGKKARPLQESRHELFYPQIGVGKRLDGGRRRVKKYLWSF